MERAPNDGEELEARASEQALDADQVERSLEALEAHGARQYDAPACDCVRALLTRSEQLPAAVGERLVSRAWAHVCALRERFELDRARAQAAVERLEASHGAQAELRAGLERGELAQVARRVRKLSARPPVRALPQRAGETRTPGRPADRLALRRRRAGFYEDSVASLVASFALARAVDVVPEDAGPYNPLRIASDALDRMREISPVYLTVQLNRLEELASLLSLPELPPAPEPKLPPKAPPGGKKARRLKGSA